MDINYLLKKSVSLGASDLYISVGARPTVRIGEKFEYIEDVKITAGLSKKMLIEISSESTYQKVVKIGEVDFSIEIGEYQRFRVNSYKQMGNIAISFRIIPNIIPTLDELFLPQILKTFIQKHSGLILITGSTGSGKSTTLASLVDLINSIHEKNIITLEDPIEYVHKHKKSIVNQREIGTDTSSFNSGLVSSLRQSPDVILIGEIRDKESMSTTLRAAETGHLVFSTLHTMGAAKSVDRIVDMFSPSEHYQIRAQLSSVCEGIVSQQLVPRENKLSACTKRIYSQSMAVATEVMVTTQAIRNLIREGKTHQISNLIQTGSKYGMNTMDQSLVKLFLEGEISEENLLLRCVNREFVEKFL
ncbi:type IV pilus twitching motility protein PilT [Metaclostridioides mangenotii]|uniref:type IV pilus twitching motility protein PilT n=1 Tax=Metaclostridioides mangenotii TaxID=1540 RepID=UPI0004842800|nr:type IV pilus twitching motility protein PilT [Clostridioides mangenotii]